MWSVLFISRTVEDWHSGSTYRISPPSPPPMLEKCNKSKGGNGNGASNGIIIIHRTNVESFCTIIFIVIFYAGHYKTQFYYRFSYRILVTNKISFIFNINYRNVISRSSNPKTHQTVKKNFSADVNWISVSYSYQIDASARVLLGVVCPHFHPAPSLVPTHRVFIALSSQLRLTSWRWDYL